MYFITKSCVCYIDNLEENLHLNIIYKYIIIYAKLKLGTDDIVLKIKIPNINNKREYNFHFITKYIHDIINII